MMAQKTTRLMQLSKRSDANIVLAAAFILPGILAIGGLAIDLRLSNNAANELQFSLDAAALAALNDDSITNANVTAFAQSFVAQNMDAKCIPSVSATKQTGKVTVDATCTLKTTLLVYINKPTITVDQNAVAERSQGGTSPCVLALSGESQTSIRINSSGTINAPNCAVQSNATGRSAIFVNNRGSITADSVCAIGEVRQNNGGDISPAPEPNCPKVSDPLASLPIPENAEAPCERLSLQAGFDQEISPGVYCGNTTVNGGTTLTLQPGTYVFRDGPIILNSGSSLVGSDVTLYFHDKRSLIRANSRINLQIDAPDTGPYAGIAVFQNQSIESGQGPSFQINSDSQSYIEGIYYTPRSELTLNSDAGFNNSASYSMIVVDRLTVNAGATLNLNADYDSATPLPEALTTSEPKLTQ